MPGLSQSLNIGLSGLQANQSALSTVGHNIANVNTPNFARQRVSLNSNSAQLFGNLEYGQGVNLSAISGVRDRFLEMQVVQATSRKSGADVRFAGVEGVSPAFIENDEASLGNLCQKFFQSFQELSARPEDMAVRTNVIGRAKNLVDGLQSRYQVLENQRTQADRSVGSLAQEVNNLTTEIAKLNGRIATEITPGMESDARDQRLSLATKLSELIGVQVFEDSLGQMQITTDGGSAVLVNGNTAMQLQATRDNLNYGGMLRVDVISSSGTATDITKSVSEGSLGANLDLRDNSLVGIERSLDQLAAGITGEVNKLHFTGYGLDGTTNRYFFQNGTSTIDATTGLPTSALVPDPVTGRPNYKGMVFAMSVNSAIANDPKLIAASGAAPVAGKPVTGDNQIAKKLAELQNQANKVDTNGDLVGDAGPYSNFIGTIANQVGTLAQGLQTRSTNDENLLVGLQNQRNRVSGVDLDEEATNMMTYQRGYQASARFVNVINELTDQLVNTFGR